MSSTLKQKKCEFCGELMPYRNKNKIMCDKCKKVYHRIYVWTMNNLDKKLSDFKEDNE